MPGSARIDTGKDGLQLVPATNLSELMPPTMKGGEIVLAIGIGMPRGTHTVTAVFNGDAVDFECFDRPRFLPVEP